MLLKGVIARLMRGNINCKMFSSSSIRIGESDTVITKVKYSVVTADEDVTENPQRTGRRRNFQTDKTRNTSRNAITTCLHNLKKGKRLTKKKDD